MARENNIKNWLSNYSIKPRCLEELLKALKFEEQEVKAMMNASSKINSAHISAGHQISQTLMNELDENLESIIDDKGYYIFQSNEFAGTLFNIEEIKKISKKTYFISEKETLKIIKG